MSKQQRNSHNENEETTSINLDRQRLSEAKMLGNRPRVPKLNEMNKMIDVYLSSFKSGSSNSARSIAIHCALIPLDEIDRVLSSASWDLLLTGGTPNASMYYEGRKKRVEYLRYGVTNQVEPLVFFRYFYGLYDDYVEICEEFRLFHNLYHDRKTDKYIKIDEEGNGHLVAVVEPKGIQIKLKEIRQFLAIKEMYLSIQFDYSEYSMYSLKELELEQGETHQQKNLMRWCHSCGDSISDRYKSFSRLFGKELIEPLPKSKSGFWGFAEEPKKEYIEFIIGVDDNGDEITNTSDPDALANNFGANPDSPHYLTSVHFHKQVLDKYYRESSKYSVEDSFLSCGHLWKVRIDNHHDDKVCTWLGDLGRDLPYAEQQHWRLHNIPPEGSVSETYFRRQILALPMNSNQSDHLFKQKYNHLQKESEKYLGWQLLQPLDFRDDHHFKGLRISSTDEQGDFDALVLSLTKILIDSLNQKELKKLISLEQEQNLPPDQKESLKRSIGCLEIALNSCGVENATEHIAFLRNLQKLRSTGTAHRKGSNYQKIANYFGLESQSLREVFAGILSKALDVLDYFIFLVRSRQINPEIIEQNNREKGYAILDEMVGFADFDSTDGSVNHDEVIYELDSKP